MSLTIPDIIGGNPASAVAALNPVSAIGTSIVGDAVSAYGAHREAVMNRDFQQQMSSTAHQREVRDLIAAGLNPILSGTGGSGSSTPGGSMAPMPQQIGSRAVSSGLSAQMNQAQVDLLHAQTEKTQYDATSSFWDSKTAAQEYLQSTSAAARAANLKQIYDSPAGPILQWIDAISSAFGGAGSSASAVRRGFGSGPPSPALVPRRSH